MALRFRNMFDINKIIENISRFPATPTRPKIDSGNEMIPQIDPTIQGTPAAPGPAIPVVAPPVAPMDALKQEREGILNKDYSIKTDEQGNVVRGKDRDADHNWWDVIKSIGMGVGRVSRNAQMQGRQADIGELLGGAIGGGVSGAANRNYDEQFIDEIKIAGLDQRIAKQGQMEDADAARGLRRAQTGEILRKPEKEQQDREFKLLQEVQKQQNRLEAKAAERAAKGLATKYGTAKDGSGRVVIIDGNGKEEFVTQPDGSFEYNELERPTKRKLEDGTEISVKGSQALSNETQKKIAEASLALNKERFAETKRSNRVRESLAQKHFDTARSQWTQTFALRQQTEQRQAEAQQSGDTAKAQQLALEKARLDAQLENMRVNWKKGIGTGGFTAEDYKELTDEAPD